MNRARYTETRRSHHSLDWDRLPELGADRHVACADRWHRIIFVLGAFWLFAAGAALALTS